MDLSLSRAEILIVGAGIAGASLAAAIGNAARIILIEGEDQPGYHSTGRSAAFWSETYGGPAVQPLTSASLTPLQDGGFLKPRGCLHVAGTAEGRAALDRLAAEFAGTGVVLEPLDRAGIERWVPGVRAERDTGLYEPSCADIDVAALHADCLGKARRAGVEIVRSARLLGAAREGGGWVVETTAGRFAADILVNAAGAWADDVARLAGVAPIGIQPYRRTVIQLAVDPPAPADLPLVMDAEELFYFKPEAGKLWLSPHDETACDPCDAAPEELDVAIAIDRMEHAVDWRILKREHAWAGLRSFSPDRAPVYGFDAKAPGFFWCAGQGGFGIQTAPAAAALAAALLLGRAVPAGLDPERYVPGRFG
ncbi:NAD(P)/FAD-dependent oxidoreductase [Sphingomonas crocodyli]|uniref:FAD-binding oxidoreductase n=1 Tax=Sphingomonas crocodyli TaxID=1979270 RepID=A0A437M6K4_9SPHN|nr:FAD-binding oxidoreductase [Sphingomonas crocodyli]RVT93350.1 FAD-binding oxidoreductase [Sphingomonas crocodyli]